MGLLRRLLLFSGMEGDAEEMAWEVICEKEITEAVQSFEININKKYKEFFMYSSLFTTDNTKSSYQLTIDTGYTYQKVVFISDGLAVTGTGTRFALFHAKKIVDGIWFTQKSNSINSDITANMGTLYGRIEKDTYLEGSKLCVRSDTTDVLFESGSFKMWGVSE